MKKLILSIFGILIFGTFFSNTVQAGIHTDLENRFNIKIPEHMRGR